MVEIVSVYSEAHRLDTLSHTFLRFLSGTFVNHHSLQVNPSPGVVRTLLNKNMLCWFISSARMWCRNGTLDHWKAKSLWFWRDSELFESFPNSFQKFFVYGRLFFLLGSVSLISYQSFQKGWKDLRVSPWVWPLFFSASSTNVLARYVECIALFTEVADSHPWFLPNSLWSFKRRFYVAGISIWIFV